MKPWMSGEDLVRLMRKHKVTIATLARRLQMSQEVVRDRRYTGLKHHRAARDWIEAITGTDPGDYPRINMILRVGVRPRRSNPRPRKVSPLQQFRSLRPGDEVMLKIRGQKSARRYTVIDAGGHTPVVEGPAGQYIVSVHDFKEGFAWLPGMRGAARPRYRRRKNPRTRRRNPSQLGRVVKPTQWAQIAEDVVPANLKGAAAIYKWIQANSYHFGFTPQGRQISLTAARNIADDMAARRSRRRKRR